MLFYSIFYSTLLLLHKIRASSIDVFRLIFFITEQALDVGFVIQAQTLLTTLTRGALFLPQMGIQTETIVLDNIYNGKYVTIMMLKHVTNGMSINCYLLRILQKWPFSGAIRIDRTMQAKKPDIVMKHYKTKRFNW